MKNRKSELQLLEDYRLAFSNYEKIPDLAAELSDYGYDAALMAEGKTLYDRTRALYSQNQQETKEESEAYKKFSALYDAVSAAYTKHRKRAKVALLKRPELWKTFAIDGATATAYLPWAQNAKTFYTQAKTHPDAKPLLAKFKITDAVADEQLAKFGQLETLRDAYNKEKGESQDATKNKDAAFAALSDWMSEFYATAKIALEDHPQLLESLGKWMRS